MDNNKAKYIGKSYDKNSRYRVAHLFYEYRGYEYMITDYGWSHPCSLAKQHREEQERIDALIDKEEKMEKSAAEKGAANKKVLSVNECMDALCAIWNGDDEVLKVFDGID